MIAKVVLDIQNNKLSFPLFYSASSFIQPDIVFDTKISYEIQIGCIVIVPFGKQYKKAFVVDLVDEKKFEGNAHNLKKIACVASDSFFNKDNIAFAEFISKKYMAPLASCFHLFISPGSIPKLKHENDLWIVTRHNFRLSKNNIVKKYVNENLKENQNYANFKLTNSQKIACDNIFESIENQKNEVYVLDGVTGSGKTEVYIRCIEKVLSLGKTAILLIPEISLTPQTISRFYTRFADKIGMIHSKMTPSERFNQIDDIKKGKTRLLIGARSALFAPMKNIGIIIVDEEHENSYKQDKTPRYHVRECAEWLAKKHGVSLLFGSATPSFEAIYNCSTKSNWNLIKLPERTNNRPLPKIDVIDMAKEFKNGSKNMFSFKLKNAIIEQLKDGNKVILFHNRRGFANYVFCRNCGYIPVCDSCSTTLTYHQSYISQNRGSQSLLCHHCQKKFLVPIKCPKCSSPYIAKYGAGTQSIEENINSLLEESNLEDVCVLRMDADTTKNKNSYQSLLSKFSKSGPAVLIGTQMISKGLDFHDVSLVGIVLIDTNLNMPDFRAAERTFNLITQVAGRCGRGNIAGRVIVQTYMPQDTSIECASVYDKNRFQNIELAKRKLLHYPPFYSLVNIVFSGKNEQDVCFACNQAQQALETYIQNTKTDIEIVPATSCIIEKLRNNYRYHIILKSKNCSNITEACEKVLNNIKIKTAINLKVDIDPINLL